MTKSTGKGKQPEGNETNSGQDFGTLMCILKGRAFRMFGKVGELFKKLYGRSAHTPEGDEQKLFLQTTYSWLVAPYSLWPVDFSGLGEFVYGKAKRDKELDPEMQFLLRLVKELPSEHTQQVIGDYEHVVQYGAYDPLLHDNAKYLIREKQLLDNPEFHADWAMICQLYKIEKYQSPDSKQIIRRTLVGERNMRPELRFRWGTERSRFQQVFDCFAWKHSLYGMEGNKPLLMKVTVNPTPHGLQIYIPSWMSIDIWRDLVHSKITELQNCRGILRQGPKFSESRLQNQDLGKRVLLAHLGCLKDKITGKARIKQIIEKAGLPANTTDRKIRKYRALGELLTESESNPEITDQQKAASLGNPGKTAKFAQAQAVVASLNAEEKAEFMKWLSA